MIATLPMYDWPEVRAETDALWAALRDGLRGLKLGAPETLSRSVDDPWSAWRDPKLVLSQTCGLPFAARLTGEVSLVGAPDYDLQGCPRGFYRSAIVVRAENDTPSVEALRGGRFAFNMRESQSGWACFATQIGDPGAYFGELVESGAHRASIQAVADGRADVACIDGVSWKLAERWEPSAAKLRVVAHTEPTPGLPYITALRPDEELSWMRLAVETAIEDAGQAVRNALLLKGFVKRREEDYASLAAGWPG